MSATGEWRPIAECPQDASDVFMVQIYGHGMSPTFGIGYWHPRMPKPTAFDSVGEQFDPTHFMTPPGASDDR